MDEADATLIERAKAGDTDAFRSLVERHSGSVFRLGYRMTGNEFDAEDVVQEAFLRAYRQLGRYQTRSSFSTWIYRIAANYALDLIRSRRRHEERRVRVAERDGLEPMETVASLAPQADRVFYSGQVRDSIEAALGALSDQERTAFLLRHFENKSIEEIGEVLGTAASATKQSIFRAVRKLRAALQPMVDRAYAAPE